MWSFFGKWKLITAMHWYLFVDFSPALVVKIKYMNFQFISSSSTVILWTHRNFCFRNNTPEQNQIKNKKCHHSYLFVVSRKTAWMYVSDGRVVFHHELALWDAWVRIVSIGHWCHCSDCLFGLQSRLPSLENCADYIWKGDRPRDAGKEWQLSISSIMTFPKCPSAELLFFFFSSQSLMFYTRPGLSSEVPATNYSQ